jgi:transposase
LRRWLVVQLRVVGERFGIAKSSVIKWHQRYRKTGSVAPGKMGGHPPTLGRRTHLRMARQMSKTGKGLGEINPLSRKLATRCPHQDGIKVFGKSLIL